MTESALEFQGWNWRRWLAVVASVLLLQLLMIFWLSRHQPELVRQTADAPMIFVAEKNLMDQLPLASPVRFAVANRNGFSGGAWLEKLAQAFDSPEYTEPLRPLALTEEKLGSALGERSQAETAMTFELPAAPEPQFELLAPLPDLPAESSLTVEGALTGRSLVSVFKLESIPAPEILSNSVVQVGVNRDGTVFSAVLAEGLKESKEGRLADAAALNYARAARFEPLRWPDLDGADASAIQWGRLVFHWRTVPIPATNATLANP